MNFLNLRINTARTELKYAGTDVDAPNLDRTDNVSTTESVLFKYQQL